MTEEGQGRGHKNNNQTCRTAVSTWRSKSAKLTLAHTIDDLAPVRLSILVWVVQGLIKVEQVAKGLIVDKMSALSFQVSTIIVPHFSDPVKWHS